MLPTPLDQIADPSDATYVPRPEWYFLSLFQLLKYFPGPLEPLATMVIPGLVVGVLLLLPFIDRRPDRHFLKRPLVTGGFAIIGGAIIVLTYLGYKDTPAHANPSVWGPLPIAGHEFVQRSALRDLPSWAAPRTRSTSCVSAGTGMADLARARSASDRPRLREPPLGGMNDGQARSIASYMRKVRVGV